MRERTETHQGTDLGGYRAVCDGLADTAETNQGIDPARGMETGSELRPTRRGRRAPPIYKPCHSRSGSITTLAITPRDKNRFIYHTLAPCLRALRRRAIMLARFTGQQSSINSFILPTPRLRLSRSPAASRPPPAPAASSRPAARPHTLLASPPDRRPAAAALAP